MDFSAAYAALRGTIVANYNALVSKLTAISSAVTTHLNDRANPHKVTKAQVDLGNVPNFKMATKQEAEEGLLGNRMMSPERVAQSILVNAPDKTADVEIKIWQGL